MKVIYAYDAPLPSRLTAWIQILNTCRSLAELDVEVEVIGSRMRRGPDECLAFFGITPHPRMTLRAWPDFPTLPPDIQGDWLISRDDRGIRTFMTWLNGSPAKGKPRMIYEAHRVCFINRGERDTLRGRMIESLPFVKRVWARLRQIADTRLRKLRSNEGRVLKHAAGVIALSRPVADDLVRFFHHGRPVLILPSGTGVPGERPPLDGRDLDIVYAGKLFNRKGVMELLTAMTHLPNRRLTILGGRKEESATIRAMAESIGVAERVDLLGYVQPALVRGYLTRAKVGVCPMASGVSSISERYTSPLKIVENWAAGTPLVAVGTHAVREMVRAEVDALVVPPGDSRKLADAIASVLNGRELAERLARQGFEAARERSWDCRAAKLKTWLVKIPG